MEEWRATKGESVIRVMEEGKKGGKIASKLLKWAGERKGTRTPFIQETVPRARKWKSQLRTTWPDEEKRGAKVIWSKGKSRPSWLGLRYS